MGQRVACYEKQEQKPVPPRERSSREQKRSVPELPSETQRQQTSSTSDVLHGGKGERQSSASKQNQEQKTPSPTSTSFYKEGGGTFTIRYEHALLQVQAVKVYQASSYRLRVT